MPHPLLRVLRALAAAVVLTVALSGLHPLAPATAIPVEGYPSYQPQSTCSPRAKAGTLMLADHLLKRYRGSGSSGISRSCASSGISEHKEGRAFDWTLSASSRRDRGYARDFLSRIRATDRRGHRNALARRMGIMYVIWNDHIWSASDGYRKTSYRHAACPRGRITRCSVTLRHRDHMHISLSRRAARGKTSWYLQRGDNRPARKVKVRAKARATAKATVKVTEEVRGSKASAKATGRAKAIGRAKAKATSRSVAKERAKAKAKARAEAKAEAKARSRAHDKASARAKAKATARAEAKRERERARAKAKRQREREKARAKAKAEAKARAEEEARAKAEREKRRPKLPPGVLDLRRKPYRRIKVPASGESVVTGYRLRGGVTYSVTAGGLYSYGTPRQVSDANCTWSAREEDWVPLPSRRTRRTFGRLDLVVNGDRIFGDECRDNHTYRTTITPAKDRPLRLRLAGKHPSSTGRITVVVGRARARVADALPEYPEIAPEPGPVAAAPDGYGLIAETLELPADGNGTYTVGSLERGAEYRLTVSGVVNLGGRVRSDGKCVEVRGEWYRSASIDLRRPEQDHGNLYVNGVPFDGRGETSGCSTSGYTAEVEADSRGRLRLDLWDPHDRSDNSGELTVSVQRLTTIATPEPADRERPRRFRTEWQQRRDSFAVNPGRSRGTVSTMRLRKGERVTVTVRGRYRSGAYVADASCVKTSSGWDTTHPGAVSQDPLEVWVDGTDVRWRPRGRGGPCSEESTYRTTFTATKNGPVRVSVFDLDHRDNTGSLDVVLRRRKS